MLSPTGVHIRCELVSSARIETSTAHIATSPYGRIPDHTKTHAPSRSNAFTESIHVWDSSDKHREHAGVHIGHDQNFIN